MVASQNLITLSRSYRLCCEELYDYFVEAARQRHPIVETGVFGANMQVSLINDGPVTIPIQL